MRLGFIFDTRFFYYKNHYYTSNLTPELWEKRYLKVFDDIVVIGRETETEEDPSQKMTKSDIPHVSFRCIEDVSRAKRLVNQKNEAAFIEESIKDCDFIISRSWWGVPQCKKLKKPYMIEIISCAWDVLRFHSSPFARIAALPNYLLMKKTVKEAPFVNYVTQEFLQRRYPTTGVSFAISDVQIDSVHETVLHKRLERISQNKEVIVLGTAGALDVDFKGQKQVIKSISMLKRKGINRFKYVMVGNGKGSKLIELANELGVIEQINVMGEIPHKSMPDWYDSIDLYIHPSRAEGLSRAIIEAEMRGVPCIAANAGGNNELLDKECIFPNDKNNEASISDMLESINRDFLEKQAIRNYNFGRRFDNAILDSLWVDMLGTFVALGRKRV